MPSPAQYKIIVTSCSMKIGQNFTYLRAVFFVAKIDHFLGFTHLCVSVENKNFATNGFSVRDTTTLNWLDILLITSHALPFLCQYLKMTNCNIDDLFSNLENIHMAILTTTIWLGQHLCVTILNELFSFNLSSYLVFTKVFTVQLKDPLQDSWSFSETLLI